MVSSRERWHLEKNDDFFKKAYQSGSAHGSVCRLPQVLPQLLRLRLLVLEGVVPCQDLGVGLGALADLERAGQLKKLEIDKV